MKKQAKDVVAGDSIYFPERRVADKVVDARTIAAGPVALRQLTGYESRWTLPIDAEVEIG